MSTNVGDARLPLPVPEIHAICRRFGVERLEVFGSSIRDDFNPDSAVDFLVVFRDPRPGLTDFRKPFPPCLRFSHPLV